MLARYENFYDKRDGQGRFAKMASKKAGVKKSNAKVKATSPYTIGNLAKRNQEVGGSGFSAERHPNRSFAKTVFTGKMGTFFIFSDDDGDSYNVREFFLNSGHTSYNVPRVRPTLAEAKKYARALANDTV
jgi:hypothetical protein